jgi:hypothetical protein
MSVGGEPGGLMMQYDTDRAIRGGERRVLAAGGVSGLKEGTLGYKYSYLMLPFWKKLIRTLTLKLDGGCGKSTWLLLVS